MGHGIRAAIDLGHSTHGSRVGGGPAHVPTTGTWSRLLEKLNLLVYELHPLTTIFVKKKELLTSSQQSGSVHIRLLNANFFFKFVGLCALLFVEGMKDGGLAFLFPLIQTE